MKILKNWNQFNELKTGTVKFSDLDDNWSAEYHLDDDIKDIKKNYKKYGKEKTIDKIVKIVNNLDKNIYNKFKRDGETRFKISLPKYEQAKDKKYWVSNFPSVSKIIITLSSINTKKYKDQIKKEIEELQKKLEKLEKLDESWGVGNTIINKGFDQDNKDKYEYIGYNEEGNLGNEDLEVYDEVYEYGKEVDKKDLTNYISLSTLKNMFPVYNDIDFYNDWSVGLYEYKDYFMIQQSGWLYLFRKK